MDWWRLVELGIDDDGTYPIDLQVSDGTSTATASTTLTVTNTEPTVTVDGSGLARAGGVYSVEVTVDGPGDDTVASWRIDWGDGTATTGTGLPGTQSRTYPATSAGLTRDILVSITDEDGAWIPGDLFIPEYDDPDTVGRVVPETGLALSDLTSGGPLGDARNATIGPDGSLYVSSSVQDDVLEFDGTTGAYIGLFATHSDIDEPMGLTFGPDGRLYIADSVNDTVVRVDGTTGAFIDEFIVAGAGTEPMDVEFGPDGNLYVSLRGSGTVRRFNA